MIAAIVLNWNGTDDTLGCVASLLREPGVSVLVVDNGSREDERARLRVGLSGGVALIESPTNLGFSGGCNLGARAARERGADVLVFVNNDARVAPGCLAKLSAALEAGWSVVNPVIFEGLPEDGFSKIWFEKGSVALGNFIVADHVAASPDDRGRPVYESALATGCVLAIRATDFFAHGGFDEGLFAYFEDVDLSLKLRKAGGRCGVVREAHAWHRGSASSGGYASPLSLFYLFRNGPALTERHGSPEELARYRKRAPLQMLAAAANFSQRELASGAAALNGAWAALRRHQGAAPKNVAPTHLLPLAWFNYTAWRLLRRFFRKTPPKGAPEPKRR